MQNGNISTAHIGAVSERLRRLLKKAAVRIMPIAVGFFLAQAEIIGDMYPFGAAYAAAAPRGAVASAIAGIIAGYFFSGSVTGRLRYIATALAIAGIKWALAEIKQVSRSPLFCPAAAFAGIMLTGAAVSTSTGTALGLSLLTYAAEGLISAAAAVYISGTIELLTSKGKIKPSRQQAVCCIVTAIIAAIPLCNMKIFGFSPVRAALMICILIAARQYREAGGAVAGIALGTAMALSGDAFALSGICAAAGLMAALFAPLGAVLSAAAFSAVCILGAFAAGSINVFFIAEALIAATVYSLLKPSLLDRLPSLKEEKNTDKIEQASACGKLLAAADGLSGVSETVSEITKKLEQVDAPNPETLYRRASEELCSVCAISSFCWGSAREATNEQFSLITPVLQRDGALTRANSPEELKKQCARWGEMTETINRLYADYAARERAQRRVSQVRSVVSEQLGGVSELLCELAEETELCSDPKMTKTVRKALEDAGYSAGNVRCVWDSQGRLTVTAAVTGRDRLAAQRSELVYFIEEASGIEFMQPKFIGGINAFTLELVQKAPLRVDFGAAQHCCGDSKLCGDSYDAMLDDNGGAVMLLSDGMGSGGRAAVDSAMTCGLLGRLLRAGFGVHGALRVVNSALLIKSDDESLSTADCMRMSLFTGEADFCKAGAAQSFVLSRGKVTDVDIPSLPLGIMRELDCGSAGFRLSAGDVVLMVSDGAIVGDAEWLRSELERFDGHDPRSLARNIVALASAMRGDSDDDITALVLCCRENAA